MSSTSFRSPVAHVALVAAFALGALGCGSSRPVPPADAGGYSVARGADGSVNITVTEDASGETLMAALMEAAAMNAWHPPETAPHLTRVEQQDLGASGTAYRYRMDHLDGRFDVYVYRDPETVEAQVAGTQSALEELIRQGRIESAEIVQPLEAQRVVWDGQPAVLHRVVFAERMDGAAVDSYMYMIEDDLFWIKARVTTPAGRATVAEMDALVRGLLGV